jgi:hypothetical protein
MNFQIAYQPPCRIRRLPGLSARYWSARSTWSILWLYLSIRRGIARFLCILSPNSSQTLRAAVDVAFGCVRFRMTSSKPMRVSGSVVICRVRIVSNGNSIGRWIFDKNKTKLLSFQAVCRTKLSFVGACQIEPYREIDWLACSAFFFNTNSWQIPEFVQQVSAVPYPRCRRYKSSVVLVNKLSK